MTPQELAMLIILGAAVVAGIAAIVFAIIKGDAKKDVIQWMEEAGELYKDLPKPEKSVKKLQYVVDKFKEKYKLGALVLNVKTFIEYIVQINNKDM